MATQERKGIEIFALGTWNKNTFSSSDLDAIVESFHALGFAGKVPLKLGHEGPDGRLSTGERDKKGRLKDPMSQFAMGWVNNIYRDGNRILADIEVPDKVARLIDDKFLKFVSVELMAEVRTSRRVFPWVLDAVALLGTDPPAVGILEDIQTLAMTAALQHADVDAEKVVFARADKGTIVSHTIGELPRMAEITLETLSAKMLELSEKVSALTGENQNLKVQLSEAALTDKKLKKLQADVRETEIASHRTMIKDTIDAAVKAEVILPAARERFLRVYKVEGESDQDVDYMLSVTKEDVAEFITENPNPKKPKDKGKKVFTALKSVTDELPEGIEPDKGMVLLMQAQLRDSGIKNPTDRDIEAAAVMAMRANPDAAANYQQQQLDIERGVTRRAS